MQNRFLGFIVTKTVFVLTFFLLTGFIITASAQQQPSFDVTDYRIEAQFLPANNRLQVTADVTFLPKADMRTVTFELNGSLKVESVQRIGSSATVLPAATPAPKTVARPTARPAQTAPPQTSGATLTFVQDQVGVSNLGPNVRVELSESVAANTPVTLRFRYAGTLLTPEGGVLATKRLAAVTDEISYLLYPARWFPFHNYAADKAASDITLIVPAGLQAVGYSEEPVTASGGRYRFVNRKPGLIGNFAVGKFSTRNVRSGNYEVQFFTRVGNDARIGEYGEMLGRALQFYNGRFGANDTGNKFTVVQIDDESLDVYSAPGMLFLSTRYFENPPQIIGERLQREAAYQWWGHTVGLKSFDDAWISQGLAEYSALELREQNAKAEELEDANRELLERALSFEQTASILNAPSKLDDTTAAYQYVMFYKGAAVYRLLRETMGKDKFNQLLRTFLNQYRGKTASIEDFEKLASQVHGSNLRYFFARWVDSTGVPEFNADYQIIRTRSGKFIARGTVKQNYENLRLPVDIQLRAEGGDSRVQTVRIDEQSEDFNIESNGAPVEVVIDPQFKLLRIDQDLRVSSIARRGIEQFKEGNYAEAQQQFEAALKLDRSNSWIYYHLGLLFLEQRNYDLAIENFKATLTGNLRPNWLQVWAEIKMGNAYDAKGDRDRALSAYQRAQKTGINYDNAQNEAKKYIDTPYDPRNSTTAAK
ncbi:MAG: tetratricopeptide repeat protein [Acidobacteriota bacterium]|nr:tetratricopeptide repeat protein [Acidobacteriota bacterium]